MIREARREDAEAISMVLVASIAELCGPDHGGDAALVERWTNNKSPAEISSWLDNPRSRFFVAEDDGEILCVGACSEEGEIQLNYVAPKARFRGLSRAMLAHMEDHLRRGGIRIARLTSTETAHRFYRDSGWADCGGPQEMFGLAGYPMTKTLAE